MQERESYGNHTDSSVRGVPEDWQFPHSCYCILFCNCHLLSGTFCQQFGINQFGSISLSWPVKSAPDQPFSFLLTVQKSFLPNESAFYDMGSHIYVKMLLLSLVIFLLYTSTISLPPT